jgi:hypothetical protein
LGCHLPDLLGQTLELLQLLWERPELLVPIPLSPRYLGRGRILVLRMNVVEEEEELPCWR